jgi:Ca2+/Na+ antiporter
MNLESAIAILGFILALSTTMIIGMKRSKTNIYISCLLTIYLIHVLFISQLNFLKYFPFLLIVLYVVLLKTYPKLFDLPKAAKGDELLEKLFWYIFEAKLHSITTFKIIAQTFQSGENYIDIGSDKIIQKLIEKAYAWTHQYYNESDDDIGELVYMTLITIANISVVNRNAKGLKFINDDIGYIVKESLPDNDVIRQSIEVARNIIKSGNPDYKRY